MEEVAPLQSDPGAKGCRGCMLMRKELLLACCFPEASSTCICFACSGTANQWCSPCSLAFVPSCSVGTLAAAVVQLGSRRRPGRGCRLQHNICTGTRCQCKNEQLDILHGQNCTQGGQHLPVASSHSCQHVSPQYHSPVPSKANRTPMVVGHCHGRLILSAGWGAADHGLITLALKAI